MLNRPAAEEGEGGKAASPNKTGGGMEVGREGGRGEVGEGGRGLRWEGMG